MKFPNKKDYIDDIEGYLDEVITCCLTIHKEHVSDSLIRLTGGKITKEQQERQFIGKQLFSDEPIYKLMRLIPRYRSDKHIDEKDEIMFSITAFVDEATKMVKSISKVNHDEELRNMVTLMIQSNLPVKDIVNELCETGWYDNDNAESLERTIHRWIKQYNLKSVT
mgnify:CR=1 FL=1|jgi:hypothetical protein|tara:strand:- start:65 stop:562 length:498 start_codon:yes stop_codon:yes gene_type:complete